MNRRDHAAGLLAGFVTGLAGGFFGIGGGAILIPILTGRFKFTQHQAHGTSLAVIGATALVSIFVYAVHGHVDWGTAALIALGSFATSRWGAQLASRTSPEGLVKIFAVFLVLLAIRLMWKTPSGAPPLHPMGGVAFVATMLVLGLAVGLLSGYMGVGGGILIVPALTLLLGWPQHLAQGTSLGAILGVAPIGSIEHARRGNVVMRWVPVLAIGAALGGPLASLLAQNVDRLLLARGFALFMLATAVIMWRRGAVRRVAPAGQNARA